MVQNRFSGAVVVQTWYKKEVEDIESQQNGGAGAPGAAEAEGTVKEELKEVINKFCWTVWRLKRTGGALSRLFTAEEDYMHITCISRLEGLIFSGCRRDWEGADCGKQRDDGGIRGRALSTLTLTTDIVGEWRESLAAERRLTRSIDCFIFYLLIDCYCSM